MHVRVSLLPDGHAGDRAPPGLRPRPPAASPRRARHGAARRAPRARDGNGPGRGSARRTGSRRAAGSSRSPTSTTRTRRASGAAVRFAAWRSGSPTRRPTWSWRRARSGRSSSAAPGLFDGYHNDPAKTAEAMRGGWLHTGDLGVVDADGRVSYRGRSKDMLKVGGENVSAMEVEAFLLGHPAVKVVQVVGVPDARYVEVPAAFVELAPDAAVDRGGADRVLPRADRARSRCRGTCASSTSGRCPRRRSRSTGCARPCSPSSGPRDAAPDHPRRDRPRLPVAEAHRHWQERHAGRLPADAAASPATSRTARSRRSGSDSAAARSARRRGSPTTMPRRRRSRATTTARSSCPTSGASSTARARGWRASSTSRRGRTTAALPRARLRSRRSPGGATATSTGRH